jgi:CheY-like chemotaxis protein
MPEMDGWAFLDAYDELSPDARNGISIVMLTTSEDSIDKERALAHDGVAVLLRKPLTAESFDDVLQKNFPSLFDQGSATG